MPFTDADEDFMRKALAEARCAHAVGEIPVGAVLVSGNDVIGTGHNQSISKSDPSAHAEVEAIRAAAAQVENYRLAGTTLYVTLEPCVMCVGLIVQARLGRLVFAARDLRFGAVRSKFRLADSELLNHRVQVEEGLMAAEAGELLTRFFQARR
jgi:tRNA(adenine34) deaminase